MYDSRLHHAATPCFDAEDGVFRERVLFYLSFGRVGTEAPETASILEGVAARGYDFIVYSGTTGRACACEGALDARFHGEG